MALAGTLAGAAPAGADVYRLYEFSVDGVLPSNDADTDYVTSGVNIPETTAYSVSGGLLHQRTMGRQGRAYYECSLPLAGFEADKPLVAEARLRVLAITSDYSTGFHAFDGSNHYYFVLDSTGAWLVGPGNPGAVHFNFDVDVGGAFHTYRLESPANDPTYSLYRDGVLVGSATAASTSANTWSFGDSSWGLQNDADVDWDYVLFWNSNTVSVERLGWDAVKALYR